MNGYTITVSSIVGIIFVCLKIFGAINWGWIWVLLPFWWPVAAFVCLFVFFYVSSLIVAAGEAVEDEMDK